MMRNSPTDKLEVSSLQEPVTDNSMANDDEVAAPGILAVASDVRDPEWRLYPLEGYQVAADADVPPVCLWPVSNSLERTAAFFEKGMKSIAVAVIATHRWLVPHFLIFIKRGGDGGGTGADEVGLLSCEYTSAQGPILALEQTLKTFLRFSDPAEEQSSIESLMGESSSLLTDPERTIRVGHHLGTLWVCGPNDYNHPLPQIPAHITRPRERIRLYQVCLPPQMEFHLPPAYSIKSVPLPDRGTGMSQIPYPLEQLPFLTGRFTFTYFVAGGDEEKFNPATNSKHE